MNISNFPQVLIRFIHGDYLLGWRSIETAPRDGTVIETKCTYGIAPWYRLHYWTNEYGSFEWFAFPHNGHSIVDERYLTWRPFSGDANKYVDPTRGRQETDEYWQEAEARAKRESA